MAVINPDIFREYDIRGIYGTDLTEEYVELIGKAYGTLIKRNNGKTVSTGRDCRLSSPSLSESLINGITSTGINVINIGIVSTPILYFSLFNMEVDGGVKWAQYSFIGSDVSVIFRSKGEKIEIVEAGTVTSLIGEPLTHFVLIDRHLHAADFMYGEYGDNKLRRVKHIYAYCVSLFDSAFFYQAFCNPVAPAI